MKKETEYDRKKAFMRKIVYRSRKYVCLPEFGQNSPKFAGIQNPDASGRIQKYPGLVPVPLQFACGWQCGPLLLEHAAPLSRKAEQPLSPARHGNSSRRDRGDRSAMPICGLIAWRLGDEPHPRRPSSIAYVSSSFFSS